MFKTTHLKIADFTQAGGETLNLRNSPFNLSPITSTILSRAKKVRENLNGRPLVILMGEQHCVASHVLAQLLTISEMHAKYKINKAAFATELSYNSAMPLLTGGGGYSEEGAKALIANDDNGLMSLQRILKMGGWKNAPFSQATLLNHCLAKSIPTCLADAATLPEDRFLMDCDDPYIRDYLAQKGKDMVSVMRADSLLGIEIRNHFMVARVQKFIEKTNATTVVMGVGNDHIFGLRNQYMFETSLANLFHKAAMDFMVVVPFGNHISIQRLPDEAVQFFPQTIGVIGMDEKEFAGYSKKSEIPYIQKVIRASGRSSHAPSAAPAPLTPNC